MDPTNIKKNINHKSFFVGKLLIIKVRNGLNVERSYFILSNI